MAVVCLTETQEKEWEGAMELGLGGGAGAGAVVAQGDGGWEKAGVSMRVFLVCMYGLYEWTFCDETTTY